MKNDVLVRQSAYVRTRLLRAPWWVLAIFTGVPFAAVMVVMGLLDDGPAVVAVVVGVAAGILFGVFMGVYQARTNRRTRTVVAAPADREVAVHRSAMKGPVPEDPETRAAAIRLVDHYLAEARRSRGWSTAVFSAFLLLGVWLALTSSPWWWSTVLFWSGFLVWTAWLPSRLERRLALLQS